MDVHGTSATAISQREGTSSLPDLPGVIVFPPVLFLSAIVLGVLLQWLWPYHLWNGVSGRIVGGCLAGTGVIIVLSAKRSMRRAGTNVHPSRPTTAIVHDGPYRFTRNPIYLGAMVVYVGLALVTNAFWPLPALVPFAFALHWGVVRREEKYLETKFGEAYVTYKARVRRWF